MPPGEMGVVKMAPESILEETVVPSEEANHSLQMYAGVKVMCNRNDECTPGAQCTMSNITNFPGMRCFCMQGFEVEDDMTCSGSPAAFGFCALSFVASLLIAGCV